MNDTLNTLKNNLDDVEAYGYIMAQLYQSFVKWVEGKREYPAKVSMRSGHPIMHAAKWLGERNQIKFNDWSEAWINREALALMGNHDSEKITKYIKQENLNKPFSLIDNGYKGTIAQLLRNCYGNKEMQTLLMLGSESISEDSKKSLFIKHSAFSEFVNVKGVEPASYLCKTIELMPQKFESFGSSNYCDKGKVYLKLKKTKDLETDCFKSFHKGMASGFKDCLDAVQSGDELQFKKYISLLLKTNINSKMIKFRESCNNCELEKSRVQMLESKQQVKDLYQKG